MRISKDELATAVKYLNQISKVHYQVVYQYGTGYLYQLKNGCPSGSAVHVGTNKELMIVVNAMEKVLIANS